MAVVERKVFRPLEEELKNVRIALTGGEYECAAAAAGLARDMVQRRITWPIRRIFDTPYSITSDYSHPGRTFDNACPERDFVAIENYETVADISRQVHKNIFASPTKRCDEEVRQGLQFLYGLDDLQAPEVMIVESPNQLPSPLELFAVPTVFRADGVAEYETKITLGGLRGHSDYERFKNLTINSCAFGLALYRQLAYVCLPPVECHINEQGQIHNPCGQGVIWRNGYSQYFLEGAPVTEEIVRTPWDKLPLTIITSALSRPTREAIIQKIGLERLLRETETRTLAKSDNHELLRIELSEHPPLICLRERGDGVGSWVRQVRDDVANVQDALRYLDLYDSFR